MGGSFEGSSCSAKLAHKVAHEIQQAVDARSCVWEGRALTVGQTEDWLPWEQLCWKGPDCRGGQ